MKRPFCFCIATLVFFCFFNTSRASIDLQKLQLVKENIKNKSNLDSTYKNRQWQKLLHFESNYFGSLESQVDSSNFFISAAGQIDLRAELEATIEDVFLDASRAKEEEKFQCRFPARYRWFKKVFAKELSQISEQKILDQSCPRFEKYLNALMGESLSLVFSSFYLNNPSSAFGHTLIRINKEKSSDGKRHELLDYGLNYAASVDGDSNPLTYALKGLFGMFPGKFTSTPYYYKVREYSHSESRDLWEYQLNVDKETVEMFIAHSWELGPAKIDYWYLTENCSYHMLTMLEAANPNIDLTSKLKKFIIPPDTVKVAFESSGFVTSVNYRPSIRTQFYHRWNQLSESKKQIFLKFQDNVTNKADLTNILIVDSNFTSLSNQDKAEVLDALLDYYDYKYPLLVQTIDTEPYRQKNLILSARSTIDFISPDLKIVAPESEKPHVSHGSRSLYLGAGKNQTQGTGLHFGYKFALHEQLDPIIGFPPAAHINFWDMQFRWNENNKKIDLQNFSLIEIYSMTPVDQLANPKSWNLKVSLETDKNENCLNCLTSFIKGGVGYTLESFKSKLLLFSGLKFAGWSNSLSNNKVGVGPNIRLLQRWDYKNTTLIDSWYRFDAWSEFNKNFKTEIAHQYNIKEDLGIRFSSSIHSFEQDYAINSIWYH